SDLAREGRGRVQREADGAHGVGKALAEDEGEAVPGAGSKAGAGVQHGAEGETKHAQEEIKHAQSDSSSVGDAHVKVKVDEDAGENGVQQGAPANAPAAAQG